MLEIEGLYKRIELLSKYLELYDKEYINAKEEFNISLNKSKKFKSSLDNYINNSLEENDKSLDEYLDLIDKDLSLDMKTIDKKLKIKSIIEKQDLIKYEIINTTKFILEQNKDESLNNINKRITDSIEYDNAKDIVNNIFIEHKKEKIK